MNSELIKQRLQAAHVHIAIPCYGGQMSEATFSSMIRFTMLAVQFNIHFTLDTMVNESLVTRARNNLVSKFLANREATHLMFIDSDIRFDPESILSMIVSDLPVVCGAYPMKGLPIRYVLNTLPNGKRLDSLVEVSTSGTGFMLIQRNTIEELIKVMPETKYKDSLNLGSQYEPFMYALFDTMIDENGHYLSEDWTFCKRVREKLGKSIIVDTSIKLDHIGTYSFNGDVTDLKSVVEAWDLNRSSGQG